MIDTNLITTTQGEDQFYPTPSDVADKMLSGIDWDEIKSILEPSAGKGNLLGCAMKAAYNNSGYNYNRNKKYEFDCIEIDPYLRQILKYNFSKDGYKTITDHLDAEQLKKIRIIHDDFLSYNGSKRYDLILMNPPFSNGDLHLLKAIEIQKNGGKIVCLLNAETIRNPYTNTRLLLKRLLNKYQAEVTFLEKSFSKAERKTDVDVAIIRMDIPYTRPESTIYNRLEQAAKQEESQYEAKELVAGGELEQMIQYYKVECAAGIELIREYEGMQPYIQSEMANSSNENPLRNCILTLSVGFDSNYLQEVDINEYLREVRLKYWHWLFKKETFMGKLTSNLRDEYLTIVDKMADYDFTMYNIQQVFAEMDTNLASGREETIVALFDKLTGDHSWYPETKNNIHYFNGWKANKAHKIGKKSIIPTSGMFSSYAWLNEAFDVSNAFKVISDIEKVFNYLDNGMTEDIDLLTQLKEAEAEGCTRNIECKYFKIDMYKKGTTHIKFTNMDLVNKLNIYAARNKKWLPPNYGEVKYADMEVEGQAVIDSFQGEKEYAKVMARKAYYLAEPIQSMPALMQAT